MSSVIRKGSLVDIKITILKAGERAEQVPKDTAGVDMVMKVKGILSEDTQMGSECTVTTAIGRLITGTLIEENPAYSHQFGPPIPELLPIGRELREILSARRAR